MEKLELSNFIEIKDKIHEVRGKQVMLDSDLAKIYQVETKRINEAVKNNPLKFPERFSFILTNEEVALCSRSKNSTLNNPKVSRGQNIKYLPRVFTEQGVAMLATILKSKKAIDTTITIMDAFVAMRHYLYSNQDILKSITNINNKIIDHDNKLDYLFSKFDGKQKIYLAGQSYDAYSDLIDIFNASKKEIIIIDPYADKILLDLIKNLRIDIILITKTNSLISNILLREYKKSHNNLKVIYNDSIHDRYIVVDNKCIYHLGASINHLGNKMFNINKFEDKFMKETFLLEIAKIIKKD